MRLLLFLLFNLLMALQWEEELEKCLSCPCLSMVNPFDLKSDYILNKCVV
jgi:hypothetical protein